MEVVQRSQRYFHESIGDVHRDIGNLSLPWKSFRASMNAIYRCPKVHETHTLCWSRHVLDQGSSRENESNHVKRIQHISLPFGRDRAEKADEMRQMNETCRHHSLKQMVELSQMQKNIATSELGSIQPRYTGRSGSLVGTHETI